MRAQFLLVAGAAALLAGSASAGTLRGTETFSAITSNSSAVLRAAIESQLVMEIYDVTGDSSKVNFKFYWSSFGTSASLTDVYWDDGALLGIASITSSSGVAFDDPATPGELPSASVVNFHTSAGFSADSDAPVMSKGVDHLGEWLNVRFALVSGKTWSDVIAALAYAKTDPYHDLVGGLRVGAHVQAIGGSGGTSDSFVTLRTIPLPSGAALAGLGLFIIPAIRRRPIAG